jgi:acyl-CoA synthetase (AMP-forming)/AMP-acid ligase II
VTNAAGGWNLAEMWERHAARQPEAIAQRQGERSFSWSEFDARANSLANHLLAAGLGHQAKVAQYLFNCPEYMDSMFAIMKAGMIPVNTNYRYAGEELVYLFTDADAEAVIFHSSFADKCSDIRDKCPSIRTWICVENGDGNCPEWADAYEDIVKQQWDQVIPHWGRSPDDLYFIYTGGTTGPPKGVMWRQDDLIGSLDNSSASPLPTTPGWQEFDRRFFKPGPRHLAAAPLMHGTGSVNAIWALTIGGSVTTAVRRSFDPVEILDLIESNRINSISIVGDVFAKPLVEQLDKGSWNLSSLRVVVSSGVMWSASTKARLLRHCPGVILLDSLGSSEAIGMASNSYSERAPTTQTPQFLLGPDSIVIAEDGSEVEPGSGRQGMVAIRGRMPVGYYKDAEKTAATFIERDGVRWSVPGDWAEVNADGSIHLFGRGSQCINSGGEKVYPEEVEEVLKRHPTVSDAAVIGVSDPDYGEVVTAIVEPSTESRIDNEVLDGYMRQSLAGYKIPKTYMIVDSLGRGANGKLDRPKLKVMMEEFRHE